MREELGKEYYSKFNCSQAVVASFAKDLDISEELALKIAAGFGGGMCKGNTCGAVTGGIIVLGLLKGNFIAGDDAGKAETKAMITRLQDEFEGTYGSVMCQELIGEEKSFERCASYVTKVIQLVEKYKSEFEDE